MTHPDCLRDRYTGLSAQKTLFKFAFFSCISTKVVINFTIHPFISKWLKRQKSRKTIKNETRKRQNERRNCLQTCQLNYP